MARLLDLITQHVGSGVVQQLGRQIGADEAQTRQALGAALPMLIGGLSRKADAPGEAETLASSLEKDHDGSILDHLSGLLGGGSGQGGGLLSLAGSLLGRSDTPGERALDGNQALAYALGNRRGTLERAVSRASGLGQEQSAQLLATLAPLVMGALGRAKRERNLDAQGVAELLKEERGEMEQQAPGLKQGGLLRLLDADNDGSLADDLARFGPVLGKFFGGRP